MGHEVETMMAVRKVPWHGLGVQLDRPPTTRDAIVAAGLDWTVTTRPLFVAETGQRVRHRACIRESDGRILGVVGPRWRPVQNQHAFSWFDPFVQSGFASLETAGALRKGERIWILARVAGGATDVVAGDTVVRYLLLSNGHDGRMAVRVGMTATRVVCANTLAVAHQSGVRDLVRLRHSRRTGSALEDVREAMRRANANFAATIESCRMLAKYFIRQAELRQYIDVVFDRSPRRDTSKTSNTALSDQIAALFESGHGNHLPSTRGTWWAAYNAVSDYLTHARGHSVDTRLNSLWFGDGAALNRRALSVALEMVS